MTMMLGVIYMNTRLSLHVGQNSLPLYSYARMYNTKLREHSTVLVHPWTINRMEGGVAFQVLYQQRLTKHAW